MSLRPRESVPAGSVTARIRALQESLTPSEMAVAQVILAGSQEVLNLSVEALAGQAGVSTATVMRLTQALGFSGFREFKIALAVESGGAKPAALDEEISRTDSALQVVRKVVQTEVLALQETVELLDEEELEAALDVLHQARRIELYGMGSSAPVVIDAFYRFLRIGLNVSTPPDSHMQAVTSSLLRPGDVAFVISHTGKTKAVINAARRAREAGATVVALTSFFRSPLLKEAHIHLVAATSETSSRVEAMASRTAHLAVIDALYVALALRDSDSTGDALSRTQDAIDEQRK